MKTRMYIVLAVANVALATSHATLVGDQVLLRHYLPSANDWFSSYGAHDVVVADDHSDVTAVGPYYKVDMNALGFEVVFQGALTWAPTPFNGLGITGMDWSDLGPGGILGVTIDTNLAGWTDSRFSYDEHSAFANWGGLVFNHGSYFDVTFAVDSLSGQPVPSSSVPDGGATAALLGLGVFGVVAAGRRAKR